MNALGLLLLRFFHRVGGSIGGAIIDDEHMKRRRQIHDRIEHPVDVLDFVIRGNDDETFGHVVLVQQLIRSKLISEAVKWRKLPRGTSFLVKGPKVTRSTLIT